MKAGKLITCLIFMIMCAAALFTFSASADGDFVINGNTLMGYTGPGGYVTLPDGITAIDDKAFESEQARHITQLLIPSSVTSVAQKNPFRFLTELQSFYVDPTNQSFSAGNGVLYNKTGTVLLSYPPKSLATSFTVPATVVTIGENALPNDAACLLSELILPDSVTNVQCDLNYLDRLTLSKNIAGTVRLRHFNVNSYNRTGNISYTLTVPTGFGGTLDFYDSAPVNIVYENGCKKVEIYGSNTQLGSIHIPENISSIHISLGSYTKYCTIYAPSGSYAQQYAASAGMKFIAEGQAAYETDTYTLYMTDEIKVTRYGTALSKYSKVRTGDVLKIYYSGRENVYVSAAAQSSGTVSTSYIARASSSAEGEGYYATYTVGKLMNGSTLTFSTQPSTGPYTMTIDYPEYLKVYVNVVLVTAERTTVRKGDLITVVPVGAPEGKKLVNIQATGTTRYSQSAWNYIVDGDNDVHISPIFETISENGEKVKEYLVTYTAHLSVIREKDKKIIENGEYALSGDTLTIRVIEPSGYKFSFMTINGGQKIYSNVYTLSVAGNIDIKAEFVPDSSQSSPVTQVTDWGQLIPETGAKEQVTGSTASGSSGSNPAPAQSSQQESTADDSYNSAVSDSTATVSFVNELSGLLDGYSGISTRLRYFESPTLIIAKNTTKSQDSAREAAVSLEAKNAALYAFDISLLRTGDNAQIDDLPDGYITFRISLPTTMVAVAEYIRVYHIADSDDPEYIPSKLITDENGMKKIEFTVSSFSPYMFIADSGLDQRLDQDSGLYNGEEEDEESDDEDEDEDEEDINDDSGDISDLVTDIIEIPDGNDQETTVPLDYWEDDEDEELPTDDDEDIGYEDEDVGDYQVIISGNEDDSSDSGYMDGQDDMFSDRDEPQISDGNANPHTAGIMAVIVPAAAAVCIFLVRKRR